MARYKRKLHIDFTIENLENLYNPSKSQSNVRELSEKDFDQTGKLKS